MALSDSFHTGARNDVLDLKAAFDTLEQKFTGARPGPQGVTGPQGPIGPTGLAGQGLTARGPWTAGTSYGAKDYVFSVSAARAPNIGIWIARASVTSSLQPRDDPTNWTELTVGIQGTVGPTGPQGAQGLRGPTGTVGSGFANANGLPVPPSFTLATLPAASTAPRGFVYITDHGPSYAYSDGVAWRNMADNALVNAPPVITGILPANVLKTWYWRFSGPTIDDIRTGAQSPNSTKYNVLSFTGAIIGGSAGDGSVVTDSGFSSTLKAMVDRWKSSGRIAIAHCHDIPLTGAVNFQLTTPTQVTNFVNGAISIIDAWGFQGIDLDFESSGGRYNATSVRSAMSQLRSHYGSSFIFDSDPRAFDVAGGAGVAQYDMLAGLIADGNLDLMSFQEYDNAVYADTSFAQIKFDYGSRIFNQAPFNTNHAKVILGASTPSGVTTGPVGTSTTYANALTFLRSTYPGFRGAAVWHSQSDFTDTNFGYAGALGAAMGL